MVSRSTCNTAAGMFGTIAGVCVTEALSVSNHRATLGRIGDAASSAAAYTP
jgi:hypothetical protein